MIYIENLTKLYASTPAVDDISFEVETGEILGFLGPNGAGKTTTMKMITCYMPPTHGRIKIAGYDVFTDSLEVRKRIGYLPENAPLYDDMNVLEYLKFVAELRGIRGHEKSSRMKKMIEVTALGDVLHKDIGELSKGFRQRVGLAQAMIHDPDILVLDEPTSGLDPNQIVDIRDLIRRLGEEKTVILSTHILPEVQATCDRVLIINRGKLVADGTPEELQSSFQGAEKLRVEFKAADRDAISSRLKELSQVRSVNDVSQSQQSYSAAFIVELEKGSDIREEIFRLAVQENWVLLEMYKEQASLENVFRELTV
ncbi:MAG: ABC transporter [Candidatus Cloacimonetes bacterium 4572_55]|nr:MAG: ABC transporter [Candidatus Cloacimonetes bacterium 4572_55]